MLMQTRILKSDEILQLAMQARLMVESEEHPSLNRHAGRQEVMAFARLMELALAGTVAYEAAGAE